jgi:hypothetical protein
LEYGGGLERDPVLAGGPGDDSLSMIGAGTVRGGPGDDYINVEALRPITVDCGPGDDDVVDDYWYLHRDYPPIVDAATCGPVLRPVLEGGARPPSGPDELSFPVFLKPHNGRVSLIAFRPSESGRGTMQLRRARSVTRLGFPLAGTKWAACSERRRFRMRAGRVVHTTLPLLARVRRRVAALKKPKRRAGFYQRAAMLPCSLHIRGVDDDGERFRRNDLSIVLVNVSRL